MLSPPKAVPPNSFPLRIKVSSYESGSTVQPWSPPRRNMALCYGWVRERSFSSASFSFWGSPYFWNRLTAPAASCSPLPPPPCLWLMLLCVGAAALSLCVTLSVSSSLPGPSGSAAVGTFSPTGPVMAAPLGCRTLCSFPVPDDSSLRAHPRRRLC